MTPVRKMGSFRLSDDLLDAMDQVREKHGTPYSVMIRRALHMWLDAQGISVKPAAKRTAGGGKTGRAK